MTLADLNACSREQFVAAVGWVFEHSPWVAERAHPTAPFTSIDALHAAMERVALNAPRGEQLALLRAHPDLGSRAAMSESSTNEQTSVGLDRLNAADFQRLQRLNDLYRRRFGFPFLYAVKGSTVAQILAALEQRSTSDPDEEFAEALGQASRIARFRLEGVLSGP